MAKRIKLFLVIAVIVRILSSFFYHHSDADTIYFWGKYLWETSDFLGFLGKEVPNAMPAVYPPLFYLLLYIWRGFYFFIHNFLWLLNIKFALFPSNIIEWFETYEIQIAFNKYLSIIADFGCAYFIYDIALALRIKKRKAENAAILFLLLPASWYLSAYWGQVDSLWGAVALFSLSRLLKNKYFQAIMLAGVSMMLKQSAVFLFPFIILYMLKRRQYQDIVAGLVLLTVLIFVIYFPFAPKNTLYFAFSSYALTFRGEINYLVSNAFNFWALIFGFTPKGVNTIFLFFPAFFWGYAIFGLIAILIIRKLWSSFDKIKFLTSIMLFSFSAFLFLPRMHERYFFLTYLLAIISGTFSKKMFKIILILSVIFVLNLYHLWWHPKISLLIGMLSNVFWIKGIIILNIGIFVYLFIDFLQNGHFDNNRQF